MPDIADLVLVGVSHRTAPVAVRERLAVPPGGTASWLGDLRARHGVEECALLSTCNRTEALLWTAGSERVAAALAGEFSERGGPLASGTVRTYRGIDAVFHLFRVASGLESQVLGESQILAQLRAAAEAARDAGALGTRLGACIDHALAAGRRVRAQTRLGAGTLSVARAAVDLAARVLGDFDDVDALVVGAGETGALVARHLREARVRSLAFMNRRPERAREAAEQFGGSAVPFDELAARVSDHHLVAVCVDAFEPVLRASHFDRVRLRRHDEPPVLLDLSLPRGIEPSLKDWPDLLLHDLDDLEVIVARHRSSRESEVEAAGRIVVEEAHKFLALRTYDAFRPVITDLRTRFEAVRDALLAGEPDPRMAEFAGRLTRRLLDEALRRIKDGARGTLSADGLVRRYRTHVERR